MKEINLCTVLSLYFLINYYSRIFCNIILFIFENQINTQLKKVDIYVLIS